MIFSNHQTSRKSKDMITLSTGMSSCPWQLALKMFQEMIGMEVEVDVMLGSTKNRSRSDRDH